MPKTGFSASVDAEGGHKHLHRVPVAVFLRLFGHGRLQRIRKTQGGVEDAPPVMAFCLSDIYVKVLLDLPESTGSIGFFREPFFLKSYGDGFRGGHTGGFFSDVWEIFPDALYGF